MGSSGGIVFVKLKEPYNKSYHKFHELVKGIEYQLFNSSGWNVSDEANEKWLLENDSYENCLEGEYGDHRICLGGLSELIEFINKINNDEYILPDYEKLNSKEITMDLFVENYKYIYENRSALNASSNIDYGMQFQSWNNIPDEVAKMTVYEWVQKLLECIYPSAILEETWT